MDYMNLLIIMIYLTQNYYKTPRPSLSCIPDFSLQISLGGNPFYCNKSLLWVRAGFTNGSIFWNEYIELSKGVPMTCGSPSDLAGRNVAYLS